MQVSNLMYENKINFTKMKSIIMDGIHIHPTSTEDHRKLIALLEMIDAEHHTHLLPTRRKTSQGRDLRDSRIHSLPRCRKTLRDKGYRSYVPDVYIGREYPGKAVYKTQTCCSLKIRVESPRKRDVKVPVLPTYTSVLDIRGVTAEHR